MASSVERLRHVSRAIVSPPAQEANVELLRPALLALVQAMGPGERRDAVAPLLELLQAAGELDCVSDAAAAAMAVCCGASSSDGCLYRIFSFSPSLHVHVREMEFIQGELGWKVWGAALVSASRLGGMQLDLRGKSVLELGSGCGLCGLLAAKLRAGRVVLSDCNPYILQNLCSSVRLLPAEEVRKSHGGVCNDFVYKPTNNGIATEDSFDSEERCMLQVRKLDWLEDSEDQAPLTTLNLPDLLPPNLGADETFDVVIGSDLLYEHNFLQPLARLLSRRMARPDGWALFVAPIRKHCFLEIFLGEVEKAGLFAEVTSIEHDDWEICCKVAAGGSFADDSGTFHGPDYYEGGCVVIIVRHSFKKELIVDSV